jgi:hypothetical protein
MGIIFTPKTQRRQKEQKELVIFSHLEEIFAVACHRIDVKNIDAFGMTKTIAASLRRPGRKQYID